MMAMRFVVLSLLANVLLIGGIGWDSTPNRTEVGHMAAANYSWRTLRFDVFAVNPPLARMIAGVPVALWESPRFSVANPASRPQDRPEWAMGAAFLKANSSEEIRRCFLLARWSLVPVLLLGGYFGYQLSHEIYGRPSAFIYLALWCTSPLLLGWGSTICPDALAGSLAVFGVYTFRRWLLRPNWFTAAMSGFCLGLLPLSKLTWVVAFGIWPLMWCLWLVIGKKMKADPDRPSQPPFTQLTFILVAGLYTLNLGYLFDGTLLPLGQHTFVSRLFAGVDSRDIHSAWQEGNRFAETWLGAIPIPLPADFLRGIDIQRLDFERGMPSYLRGQWSNHGWWYYYIYALMIKEPLGTWCLAATALALTVFGRERRSQWRDDLIVMTPAGAILLLVSSQTGFSAHARYVIPALPLLLVWASKAGQILQTNPAGRGWRSLHVVILSMTAWSVASSLSLYPHQLSYFNELTFLLNPKDTVLDQRIGQSSGFWQRLRETMRAGPRNGPRHLLGSNVDWGQDLWRLERWCQSHPEARPLHVAYSGNYPLGKGGVDFASPPPPGPQTVRLGSMGTPADLGPQPGWYALSINEIYGRSHEYSYFLEFRPIAMAGYSILIYCISPEDANRVRRKLGLPPLVEVSGDSVPTRASVGEGPSSGTAGLIAHGGSLSTPV